MTILLFSCSLCFLSYRILLLTSGTVILAWAMVVPYFLTLGEIRVYPGFPTLKL